MSTDRIEAMLFELGLLSKPQVQQLIARRRRDRQPIATLAAEMFGLDEGDVWRACVGQFVRGCSRVNLASEPCDPDCLALITPEQAWDAVVLPLRLEDGELVCATTEETLPDAISLMQRTVEGPVRFVLVNMRPLEQFIAERYAYEGVPVAE